MVSCPKCNSLKFQKLNEIYFKCDKCGYIWKEKKNNKLLRSDEGEDTLIPKLDKKLHHNIAQNNLNKNINDNSNNNSHIKKKDLIDTKKIRTPKVDLSFNKINNIDNNLNKNDEKDISKIQNDKKENDIKKDNINEEEINNLFNDEDLEYLKQFDINDDIIDEALNHLCENEVKKELLINIKFFKKRNNNQYQIKDLPGLLNLCLMKYISEFFDNDEILNKLPSEIKDIIINLRDNISFTENDKNNICNLLKENKGNNIIIYSEYLNLVLNSKKIKDIINILNEKQKEKINIYSGSLSNYIEYSSFLEKELIKDLKKTRFDYSLISLGILDKNDDLYKNKKMNCHNMKKMILYHGSQIDPIANILTSEFLYAKKAFYGMGIYFSDLIDYISFYSGGNRLENRRKNFGKIIPINSTFSFIACEIFFDKKKFKQIKDDSYYVDELDHFPSYEEIKQNYPDKMIEPNGIHFIRVDNEGESLSESFFIKERKKGAFLANEYAITEKYQILPIYSLTVKRNEYFILWRDPNFKGKNEFSDYLLERKLFCMEKANMNIYFESSTEEALKFLVRRKYNKVILITSIGLDLSGKRFIEIARKILGFDVVVLFFSVNEKHLKWIEDFPNCLYTDDSEIYEDYITNFNEEGLQNLKKDVEEEYGITLRKFSKDFLSYPLFIKEGKYSKINFDTFSPYIRHVKIYCKEKKSYLYIDNSINDKSNIAWDVTILGNEITLKMDGSYLDLDKDNENIIRCGFMIKWKFKIINDCYVFIKKEKKENNILSMENDIVKVNKEKVGKFELLQLIDVLED